MKDLDGNRKCIGCHETGQGCGRIKTWFWGTETERGQGKSPRVMGEDNHENDLSEGTVSRRE